MSRPNGLHLHLPTTAASARFDNRQTGRTTYPHISEQKRQRSEKYLNSTFRPTQHTPAGGERKSKNHWFLAAFFPPFPSLLKEMGPPEAKSIIRQAAGGQKWVAPECETSLHVFT